MTSVATRNARDAATRLVQQARTAISEANANAAEVRKTLIYTPEGKDELTSGWSESARKAAAPALQSARTRVMDTRAKAEKALKAARTVPESERATSASILAPVMAAAADDPTVLVRAYENRAAGSLADRLVLEHSIQACIDAGIGGLQFVELWQCTRAGLAETVYSEDEKTALADLAAIGGLEDYVSAAHTALDAELHAIETGSDPMHTVGNVK